MFARRLVIIRLAWIFGLGLIGLLPGSVLAQEGPFNPLDQMGFDQRLDTQVPLDLAFVDEQGQTVQLADYFVAGRPVILNLGYYECPTLCSVVRNGLVDGLRKVSLDAGRDFDVLNVSIDASETPMVAQSSKTLIVQRYGRAGAEAGWHFLTGDEPQISALAAAVGFRYYYDERIDQYGHPGGIVMLTPDGRVARYFYGFDFQPTDLRLGLVEASEYRIGTPIDQFLLFCYQYDPETGRYTGLVMNLVRGGAIVIIALIGGGLFIARRISRRSSPALG